MNLASFRNLWAPEHDEEENEPFITPRPRSVRQLWVWARESKLEDYLPRLAPCLQYRWVPGNFVSLVFALLILAMTILVLVGTITSLLNPDKYQLPWRSYCARSPSFPPLDFEILPEVGVFIGVMSVASEFGFRRREMIRNTWAAKGRGGRRTVVRFVLGVSSDESEKALVEMENEVYGDIIQLSMKENMNQGKTHAYFSWARDHALVPPASGVEWVRPEYVVKTDDDSFVVLDELEARLRVSWYEGSAKMKGTGPLIYWGYLVKEYFMAGELYALSWNLVEHVASSEKVRRMTVGPEDQQVAKWVKVHPQASDIQWSSERCWIYNHPRSGTVYSHGFLFPSEVERVKQSLGNNTAEFPTSYLVDSPLYSWSSVTGPAPRFKLLAPPAKLDRLPSAMRVEGLVEGSWLSWVLSGTWEGTTPQKAFDRRETRAERYVGKRLGGTVVVHYLKRDEWFLETAAALFGGS
ncbi:glycosyltransferase family 31 protein [Ceratobasidium sp. AG-Ba]|nr:glycosyltransferase family 31 protein [Ceratobasidium sp. AG-Ba]